MAKYNRDHFLILSDLHIPYHHPAALDFCVELAQNMKIPPDNVYSLGDFLDFFFMGLWPKGAEMPHTPQQEVEEIRRHVKQWAKAFPKLKFCQSNHVEGRINKKAAKGEIPVEWIKSVEEMCEYPKEWVTQEHFIVMARNHPFMLEHGDSYSGHLAPIHAVTHNMLSTAIGHLHSRASVMWHNTKTVNMWGANFGCMINHKEYCFRYAKHAKKKPSLGCGVIVDGGAHPIFVPLGD